MRSRLMRWAKFGLAPPVFYLAVMWIFIHPAMRAFSTHFFMDDGDGLQNVWNVWWVDRAITVTHQLPWHTDLLYSPGGVSLVAHTLNPFNGFVGILLLPFASLVQTVNALVVFSFVASGVTMFALAYHLTRSYRGSLLAGFVFTFGSYHFAHAEAHLQLVSMEWMPLFALLWLKLLSRPSIGLGVGSALALLGVILCDYYYFLYCVVAGAIFFLWDFVRDRKRSVSALAEPVRLRALVAFVVTVLLTSGPLLLALLSVFAVGPLMGVHQADHFSTDLLAPLIPGGHWRFAALTEPYWSRLPGNVHESSVSVGLSVIVALSFMWLKRRESVHRDRGAWWLVLTVFFVLSLGPTLRVLGTPVPYAALPYRLLEIVFPPLEMSGVPVRMMSMVFLAAAVLVAMGYAQYFEQQKVHRGFIVALLVLLVVEYWPAPIATTRIDVPPFVAFLAEQPGDDGVIDLISKPSYALYYQTIHHKPMAEGYISRLSEKDWNTTQRKFAQLKFGNPRVVYQRFGLRYVVFRGVWRPQGDAEAPGMIFEDGDVRIYDLARFP